MLQPMNAHFLTYPDGVVVGVLDPAVIPRNVIDELIAAGVVAQDIFLTTTSELPLRSQQRNARQPGWSTQAVPATLANLTDVSGAYGAVEDNTVIIVHVQGHDALERVQLLLRSHGSHYVNYVGAIEAE